MTKLLKSGLGFVASLAIAIPVVLHAQTIPLSERQKIELLIKHVAELKDAKFVRNGTTHAADTAATFLRRKWEANDSEVKTARGFIERVASFSGTSGKPYLTRSKYGTEIHIRYFNISDLQTIA